MLKNRFAVLFCLALAAATGPARAADDAAAHHPRGNPPLMAFHELMEPLWHSPPGKATNARACAIGDEIVGRAKAAAIRPSPEYGQLVSAAQALKDRCSEGKDEAVGADLERLHTIFHRLAATGR